MSGWRARDDDEGGEPIELVDDDRSEVEVDGGRDIDWHALLRTGAAVVAALSLVWIGRSWADERSHQRRQECSTDVYEAMWRWEEAVSMRSNGRVGDARSRVPDDVVAQIAERAEECGDDLVARSVVYRFSDTDED